MGLTFKLKNDQEVIVLDDDGKDIGQIFTPSGTANSNFNAIQICGFSEAFDLWGCGPYEGFKDIQLLFDGKKMDGKSSIENSLLKHDCLKCYRVPCQCDIKDPDIFEGTPFTKNPFVVKREADLHQRIRKV